MNGLNCWGKMGALSTKLAIQIAYIIHKFFQHDFVSQLEMSSLSYISIDISRKIVHKNNLTHPSPPSTPNEGKGTVPPQAHTQALTSDQATKRGEKLKRG